MLFNLNALIGVDKNFHPKDAEAVVNVVVVPNKDSDCLTFLVTAKTPTVSKEVFKDRFIAGLLSIKMLDIGFNKTYKVLTLKEVEIMEFLDEAYDYIKEDPERVLMAYIAPPEEDGQRAISFTGQLNIDFKKDSFDPEIKKLFTV